jgi:pimeloyl-ACP methyl ester carboxylesterase
VSSLTQRVAWWARDYAYAGLQQVRAFFSRTDAADFRTGDGTVIVVIPGVYESWKFVRPLVEELHAHGHPVHVVEQLRHNRRPVAEMAERVEAHLEEHDLTDVVIVAHSKGGLVGKQVMIGPSGSRIRGMVAVATPFGGSRYAQLMWLPTLRIFAPRNATIVALGLQSAANAAIVSIYAEFDPHIPERSELIGATNIVLDTGGHFRILADPRVLDEVLKLAS